MGVVLLLSGFLFAVSRLKGLYIRGAGLMKQQLLTTIRMKKNHEESQKQYKPQESYITKLNNFGLFQLPLITNK